MGRGGCVLRQPATQPACVSFSLIVIPTTPYSLPHHNVGNGSYNITRKHMEQLVDSIVSLGYHFVLIDCPAGIDVGFINAISPAREALIVTTPEITSIRWERPWGCAGGG